MKRGQEVPQRVNLIFFRDVRQEERQVVVEGGESCLRSAPQIAVNEDALSGLLAGQGPEWYSYRSTDQDA